MTLMNKPPQIPPPRSDILPEDLSTLADLQRNARRLGLQYASNPIVRHALTELRDFLLAQFPVTTGAVAREPHPAPETAPEPSGKNGRQRCSICADARRNEIEAALRRGMSVRQVARHFQLHKSTVGRHRSHKSHEPA